MLDYDPTHRAAAKDLINHPWLDTSANGSPSPNEDENENDEWAATLASYAGKT